jgi:hypothetical protein
MLQRLLAIVAPKRAPLADHVYSMATAPAPKAAPSGGGGGVYPTQADPKVPNKQQAYPSYLKTSKPNTKAALQRADRALANTSILDYRSASSDTRQIVRDFRRASPEMSAAVQAYIRVGIPKRYVAYAKNPDGTFNPEATSALQQVLTNLNVLNDYTLGFDDSPSMRSLSEVLAGELIQFGAAALELVLDKARLPYKLQPLSTPQITFYPSSDGKRLIPVQKLGGEEIKLDIPTFFMVTLDQDLQEPYPISPIESAIQAVLFSASFMEDLRRVVRKALHPRVDVTINEELFKKSIPPEVLNDAPKLAAFMNQTIVTISELMNGLEPEDALVHFDSMGIQVIDHGNTNLSNEYEAVQGMADAKLAAGTKVLPTVLGQAQTSNAASTEAMLFVKYVEGSVTTKLNELYSKALTLAVRLLGFDVAVTFEFEDINLRPEAEMESFRALKQSRILELLSWGFLSDEQAAIELTGQLPPAGFTPLSGTQFFNAPKQPAGDGYNGASNDGSTLNQNLKSDAPKGGARGANQKTGSKAALERVQ